MSAGKAAESISKKIKTNLGRWATRTVERTGPAKNEVNSLIRGDEEKVKVGQQRWKSGGNGTPRKGAKTSTS